MEFEFSICPTIITFLTCKILLTLMATKRKSKSPFGNIKKGTMHKALGIPMGEKIPVSTINSIVSKPIGETINFKGKKIKVTRALKLKGNFAKNARKFKH